MCSLKVAIAQNVSINDHRMIHTDGIARELVKRGHQVEVIIQECKEEPQFRDPPYTITEIPGATYSIKGQLKFCKNLYRYLKECDKDIIHAKNPLSSALPSIMVRNTGNKAKIIYDIRGLWIDFGSHSKQIGHLMGSLLNKLDSWCMNQADAIIAISEELKVVLTEKGISKDKICVIIGDGVRINEHNNSEERFDFLEQIKGKTVGYVGSIARSRSSEKIIDAFGKLLKISNQNYHLVMVGPIVNGESEYFQETMRTRDFKDRVHFTGFLPHDQALELMKYFDVVVSYHQGDLPIFNVAVPTKVLEYLAAGKAIVTTDQMMYSNILTHNLDAYLTDQNPDSFADGLFTVLTDEDLAKRLEKEARKTAQKFSFEKLVDQLESLYTKILEKDGYEKIL